LLLRPTKGGLNIEVVVLERPSYIKSTVLGWKKYVF